MSLSDKNKSYPSSQLRDEKGNLINPNYTKGLPNEINITTAAGDLIFDNPPYPIGVYIIPLVSGTIKVQLLDQEGDDYYTYSSAEVDAYIGRPIEGRVKRIFKTGTTVTGIKVVW